VPRSRVLLADDHEPVLTAVAEFLKDQYEVIAAVNDGQSALIAVFRLDPDVAVLDISMPNMTGLEAAAKMRELGLRTKVVFLTGYGDPEFVRAALDSGALGYVLKRRLASDLPLAIEAAVMGQHFISSTLVADRN